MTLIGGITLDQHIIMYADSKVTTGTSVNKKFIANKIFTYGNIAISTAGDGLHHSQLSYFIESEIYKNPEFVFKHIQKKRIKQKKYKWDDVLIGSLLNSFYTWIDISDMNNLNKGDFSVHLFATPDGIYSGISGGIAFETLYAHSAHGMGSYSAMTLAEFYKKFGNSKKLISLDEFLYEVFTVSSNVNEGVDFPFYITVIKRNCNGNVKYPKNATYYSLDKKGNKVYTIKSKEDILYVLKKEKVKLDIKL